MTVLKQLSIVGLLLLLSRGILGNDQLTDSYDLYKNGELQKAYEVCKSLVEKDPNYAAAVFLLGRIYFALGDLDNAKVYLDKAIELERANTEFREVRTQMAAFASKLTEASRLSTNADYEGAKKLYLEIIKENPNFVDAYFQLALVNVRLNDLSGAAEYLRKAIAKRPDEEKYSRQLKVLVQQYLKEGENLRQRRNNAAALEKYQQALNLDSTEFLGYYLSGLVNFDEKKYEDARRFVEKGLALNPEHSKSFLVLGQILEKLNKLEEALNAYNEAVTIDPKFDGAWDKIGVLNYNRKNFPKAIEAYLKVIEINPGNIRAFEKIGQIYIDMNDFTNAASYLEKVIEKDPNNAKAWLRLAQAYNSTGEAQKAKDAANTALKIKPNDALALIELGIAERSLGNKVAARQAFQLASKDPMYKRYAEEHLKTVQ